MSWERRKFSFFRSKQLVPNSVALDDIEREKLAFMCACSAERKLFELKEYHNLLVRSGSEQG